MPILSELASAANLALRKNSAPLEPVRSAGYVDDGRVFAYGILRSGVAIASRPC